jgi:hypothetical protein
VTTRHHKYTWSKPFTNVRHEWSLIGRHAGISFHVSPSAEYGDSAGLEIHYFSPPEYMDSQPPSHTECAYTGGRCWHDGTSLYAMEILWPMIQPMLKAGDHEVIFRVLEGEYNSRFHVESEEVEP